MERLLEIGAFHQAIGGFFDANNPKIKEDYEGYRLNPEQYPKRVNPQAESMRKWTNVPLETVDTLAQDRKFALETLRTICEAFANRAPTTSTVQISDRSQMIKDLSGPAASTYSHHYRNSAA